MLLSPYSGWRGHTERGGPTVEIKRKVVDRNGFLEEEEGGGSEVKEPQL